MTKLETNQMLASELIGTKVISANNESVGDINDVVVDRNGQAVAAVVGVGGFLGIGEKDVAVPFKSLEFATREQVNAMNKNVTSTGSTNSTTATTGTSAGNTAVNAPASSTATTAGNDNGEPERVILRMTKADLQAAPAFDTDRNAATTGTTTGTTTTMPSKAPAAPAQKP
jgi:sporulation protein YlmC with PRC-barrel domain